jgi:predicted transcriptional regulator
MATAKQIAREILDTLPDEYSLQEIADRLFVHAQVESGVADLDAGRVVPHAQVMREAAEWLRGR